MSVLFWACAVIAFVVAEIMTIQLVSIWFAAGSLVTLLFSYFYELTAIEQLGIFIISSSIFLLISLPLLRNRRNRKNAVATNAELDVGRHATVIEVINSDKGTGRVTLNGVNWSAVPENENEIIPEGTIVIVKKVMGAKLLVAPEN